MPVRWSALLGTADAEQKEENRNKQPERGDNHAEIQWNQRSACKRYQRCWLASPPSERVGGVEQGTRGSGGGAPNANKNGQQRRKRIGNKYVAGLGTTNKESCEEKENDGKQQNAETKQARISK